MNTCMKLLLASALTQLALVSGAEIAESDLWFFTDFDGSTQLNGKAVTLQTSPDGVADGRYGKGCYFHRPIKNTLPPMAEFLAAKTNFTVTGGSFAVDMAKERIALTGGTLAIAAQPDPLGYSWVRPEGGATCSFYVRGAKGTTVTLTPSISPTTSEAVKAATKKYRERGFNPTNQVPDKVIATTNRMDGTWQRVWAAVRHDCRTTDGRKVSLAVTATGPIEMERFQYEQSAVFPYLGNFIPARWTDGGTERKSAAAKIRDPELLTDFPAERGSASFWVRSVSNDWAYTSCRAFAFTDQPKLEYSFDGEFRPGAWANRIITSGPSRIRRSEKWQHVVVTWAPSNQCVYIDGELKLNTHYGFKPGQADGKRRTLLIGTATNGEQPCDAILDEVAIFRRELAADEVAALAKRADGLMANSRTLLATEVDFPFAWRNEPNAAIRCAVRARAAGEWTLESSVGGKALPPRTVKLVPGENALSVGFDPSRFRPGRYAWRFALRAKDGLVGLERGGELEIFARFDREAPTYMSWGGNHPVPNDFMKLAGLNAKNVGSSDLPAVRELVRLGIVPNIRYENSGSWKKHDFDYSAIERETAAALSPYAGLFLWNQTLVNSEVYGTWVADKVRECPRFLAEAEKAIGMKPDFTFGHAPSQVWWKTLGMATPRGTIAMTNATLRTLTWLVDRGQPVYRINAANRRAIHRLSPGNVVWTEPVYGMGGIAEDVDMMADWYYSYDVDDNLMGQRCNASALRGQDKPFMPTLSMYTGAPGRHPTRVGKDGKPEKVTMGQGLDELIVKTLVAIGATRADRLSMFSADSWSEGLKGYEAYAASPTNKVSIICDPDAPGRYGEFVRKTAMPEIRLLRGLKNVRAPVAILEPSEPDLAGGHGWIHWHFVRAMRKAVAQQAVPYDVVGDREMNDADALAKYPCLIFPMASIVTEEHDRALMEAAKRGTTVVLDDYATNSYPNCVKVASRYKNHPGLLPKTAGGPLLDWYTNRIDELRAKLSSFSSCDYGENGYTFEKRYNGVRYVMVVNNKRKERSEGGGVLLTFCTNSWYRPYCAPQRITTTLRGVPEGAAIYEFNAEGKDRKDERDGKDVRITRDFEAAEGVVYCIYPEPLEAPELKLSTLNAQLSTLNIRITTSSGKLAPGRTVLRVKVTDPEGRVTDESGDYEAVGGQCEIPIRFADGDPAGGLFSKWKAVVTDLTTGEESTIGFTR